MPGASEEARSSATDPVRVYDVGSCTPVSRRGRACRHEPVIVRASADGDVGPRGLRLRTKSAPPSGTARCSSPSHTTRAQTPVGDSIGSRDPSRSLNPPPAYRVPSLIGDQRKDVPENGCDGSTTVALRTPRPGRMQAGRQRGRRSRRSGRPASIDPAIERMNTTTSSLAPSSARRSGPCTWPAGGRRARRRGPTGRDRPDRPGRVAGRRQAWGALASPGMGWRLGLMVSISAPGAVA